MCKNENSPKRYTLGYVLGYFLVQAVARQPGVLLAKKLSNANSSFYT